MHAMSKEYSSLEGRIKVGIHMMTNLTLSGTSVCVCVYLDDSPSAGQRNLAVDR